METAVQILLAAAAVYGAAGAVFALAFLSLGVGKIDPGAKGAGLGFRLVVAPAAAALWPLLLKRWKQGSAEAPAERNAHRMAAGGDAG